MLAVLGKPATAAHVIEGSTNLGTELQAKAGVEYHALDTPMGQLPDCTMAEELAPRNTSPRTPTGRLRLPAPGEFERRKWLETILGSLTLTLD